MPRTKKKPAAGRKRKRVCKHCGKHFVPVDGRKILQRCSFCDQETGKTRKRHNLEAEAWYLFSLYIRWRDADSRGWCSCCTCGKRQRPSKMDAGHFITRARKQTKFDEKNVHAQCKPCNGGFRSAWGNEDDDEIVNTKEAYAAFLRLKYGPDKPEELQRKARQARGPFTVAELEGMITTYQQALQSMGVAF